MKRYLVFFGAEYYPSGGMNDFLTDCDSIEDGKIKIAERIKSLFVENGDSAIEQYEYNKKYNWAHIYDTEERKEVYILH